RKRMTATGSAHDAILDAKLGEQLATLLAVIALVGDHHGFIAADQLIGRRAVVNVSGREKSRSNEAAGVDADVGLIAIEALAAALGKARFIVNCDRLPILTFAHIRVGLHQGRIDDRALLEDKALLLELPVHLREGFLGKPMVHKLLAEAADRRVVRYILIQRKPHKPAE